MTRKRKEQVTYHKGQIPPPQFIIFYNGQEERPDSQVLRLSDMYAAEEETHKLDLEAKMLNINAGHNPELMDACQILWEYAEYTDRVRRYVRETSIENAVERAINECIEEGILEEFLRKNRAEAKHMSIYEYDQEKHLRQEREESWEAGREAGQDGLNHLYSMLEKQNRTEDILRAINDPEYLKQLMEEFGNSCEKVAIKSTEGRE